MAVDHQDASRPSQVHFWSRHPLAARALQRALGFGQIECVSFASDELAVNFQDQSCTALIIDTCSVVEWIHLTAEWYQKRGPVILLVPEDWVGNGLEVR